MKLTKLNKYIKLATVAAGLALSLTGCAAFFQGKVPMDITKTPGNLGDLLIKKEKVSKLDSVEQLFVSQSMYAGTINVSWKEVENATSYRIERAIVKPDENGAFPSSIVEEYPEETDWTMLREFYYDTVFEDNIINNPSASNEEYNWHYFYRIMAENISAGLSGEYSNPIEKDEEGNITLNTAVLGQGYLFAVPTDINATKGKSQNSITLTWTAVPNSRSYKIYRDNRQDFTSASLIDIVSASKEKIDADTGSRYVEYVSSVLTADQGTEFYYKVKAVNEYGNESALSSIAMGYALKAGAPVTPSNLKVIDGYATTQKGFTLEWDKLSQEEGSTLTYSIYRTTSQDAVFSLVKKDISYDKDTYYDETSIKPGIFYYYYIQSVKKNNTTEEVSKSSFSEKSDEAMGFKLSAPATLSVEDNILSDGSISSTQANLVWSKAIGSDLDGMNYTYKIYWCDTQDGSYEVLETDVAGLDYTTEGYLYTTVELKAFYKIATLLNEDESALSTAAAPLPPAPTNVNATKTKKLDKFFEPNTNEVYPVLITWSAPASGSPSGYDIYRSTSKTSSFRKLNTEGPISASDGLYYYDVNQTAKSGVFYYYKVVSLNSLGQGKKGNNPEDDDPKNGGNRESWGYGALTREQWFREYNKEIASSQAKLTLMHKASNMDKLGSESVYADVLVNGKLGTLRYTSAVVGLGGEVTMPYTDYADHNINGDASLGPYFILNGNTDTTANMSANGNMHGTVNCYHYADYDGLFQGMYPGYVIYDNLQIKSGAAAGGYYLVATYGLDYSGSGSSAKPILEEAKVDWLVGEEIRQ